MFTPQSEHMKTTHCNSHRHPRQEVNFVWLPRRLGAMFVCCNRLQFGCFKLQIVMCGLPLLFCLTNQSATKLLVRTNTNTCSTWYTQRRKNTDLFVFIASRKVCDSSLHLPPFLRLLEPFPCSFLKSSFVTFLFACRTCICSSPFRLELFAIRACS